MSPTQDTLLWPECQSAERLQAEMTAFRNCDRDFSGLGFRVRGFLGFRVQGVSFRVVLFVLFKRSLPSRQVHSTGVLGFSVE